MQAELFDVQRRVVEEAPRFIVLGGKRHKVSPAFRIYWEFATERHSVFLRRLNRISPVTSDPILRRFKFTNAYRVLDRTSQYLVREVIHQSAEHSAEDIFFRIVLFKLFNRIETWELLTQHFGEITFASYRFEDYDRVLTQAMADGRCIYSAAYIMPSGGRNGETRKHRSHLRLLEQMLKDAVPLRLSQMKSMKDGFHLLRSFPMIGDFLAYQFITDINYSTLTDFSEMEFVVAGPGALDGLKKCFPDMVPSDAASLITFACEEQERFQSDIGLNPVRLFGRPLQLIDCQNLFCETDKYTRVSHPEITGFSGRTRIKQAFRPSGTIGAPVFPLKWRMDSQTS